VKPARKHLAEMVEAHALLALEAADEQEQKRQDHQHDQRQNGAAHDDVLEPQAPRLPRRPRAQCRRHGFGGHPRFCPVASNSPETFARDPGSQREPAEPVASPRAEAMAMPELPGGCGNGLTLTLSRHRPSLRHQSITNSASTAAMSRFPSFTGLISNVKPSHGAVAARAEKRATKSAARCRSASGRSAGR